MVRQVNPSNANPAFDHPSNSQRRIARDGNLARDAQIELPQSQLTSEVTEPAIAGSPEARGLLETQSPPPPVTPASAQRRAKSSAQSTPAESKAKGLRKQPRAKSKDTLIRPGRPSPAQALTRLKKSWKWSFVWIGAFGLFAGTGLGAYLWLAGLPPLPDCRSITPLSPDANRLYCAQEVARSGKLDDLLSGISLVKDWSPNHPLYRNSQQALAKWSRLVALAARDKMERNDFKGASRGNQQNSSL